MEYNNNVDTKNSFKQHINSCNVNMLICKLFSSSLNYLNEQNILKICEYGLNCINFKETYLSQRKSFTSNELNTIIKLCSNILKSFTNDELTKPFVIALLNYYIKAPDLSSNKFQSFVFLCELFYEDYHLK